MKSDLKLALKWLCIVWLNAISGLFWGGMDLSLMNLAAMTAGIMTWFCFYLGLDSALLRTGHSQLSQRLQLSAWLRIPFQLTIYPDIFAGMVAILIVDSLSLAHNSFIEYYALTMVTGLILGLMCSAIFVLINLIAYLKNIKEGSLCNKAG